MTVTAARPHVATFVEVVNQHRSARSTLSTGVDPNKGALL